MNLHIVFQGFPGGSEGKASACNAGDPGLIPWVGKIPWRRKWQPTLVLLPGKSHGWRILVGYSPWICKEWDTTEQLHFHFHFVFHSVCTNLHFRESSLQREYLKIFFLYWSIVG